MLHAIVLDADSRERELTIAACRASDLHISGWAANGSTGLDLLESLPRTPDLIIAELRLADMDAADLIQALALLAPRSSLLICSNHEPRLRDAAFTLARALGLSTLPAVPKPLEPATLRRALAQLEPPRAPPRPAQAMTVDADALLRALRHGEFELHYQPKVALDGMRVRGAEGLLRWRHPVHGLLGPGSFLRQVQGAGLLEALTLTTLDLVLADWHGLRARGLALPLSLNLSASLLADPHLAASLIETVDHAGVPPAMLSFEITEDTELADMTAALRVLLKLRLHGFGLSLDDYGSGFSSLMRLSRIPFTELKIDRSLVHEACSRPHLLPLLRSVIRLASELGIEAVAEGVESAEDLEVLKALGCHQVQGYFLARPMPAADLARLLAGWHRG